MTPIRFRSAMPRCRMPHRHRRQDHLYEDHFRSPAIRRGKGGHASPLSGELPAQRAAPGRPGPTRVPPLGRHSAGADGEKKRTIESREMVTNDVTERRRRRADAQDIFDALAADYRIDPTSAVPACSAAKPSRSGPSFRVCRPRRTTHRQTSRSAGRSPPRRRPSASRCRRPGKTEQWQDLIADAYRCVASLTPNEKGSNLVHMGRARCAPWWSGRRLGRQGSPGWSCGCLRRSR